MFIVALLWILVNPSLYSFREWKSEHNLRGFKKKNHVNVLLAQVLQQKTRYEKLKQAMNEKNAQFM